MTQTPSTKGLCRQRTMRKKVFKKMLKKQRRQEERRDPENARGQTREFIGGWAD